MSTPVIREQQKQPEIRTVYNPKGEEYDTLRHVYNRYHDMKDYRGGNTSGLGSAGSTMGPYNFEGNWDKWEKQWNSWRPPKDTNDWKSNIYVPITTSVIEAELSEILEQDLRPFVVERGPKDTGKAKIINAILNATWDKGKCNLALLEIIKDALIFGTGIGQEYFWRQPRTIRDVDKKGNITTKDVFEYDDCYLEPVRIYDFFIDEKARSFTGPYQARDCIRRYIMDYDDFRTFFNGDDWDPKDRAKLVKPGGDTNYYEFFSPPTSMQHDREVEVLWYWNKPMDMLAIVANDVLVLAKPNPYKHKQLPFIRVVDVKIPYQFYGKGEAELLESLQEEQNTLRRMIIDRNHLDIDKPAFVSDTLTLEDEDLIARPHGMIPVGDVNAIKFPEYSDIPSSVFKTIDMITDDKVRVTGMDERQQSVSTSGTATEAAILKEQTIKRINMKMWYLRNESLIDIGSLRVANIMQFYSQPKLTEIVGADDLAKYQAQGLVQKQGGKNYKANYRTVRLENQQFNLDTATNTPTIDKAKGNSFFEARPEWFLPEHGGYDIQYAATQSVPISKPLQQQKFDELYDRLGKNQTVDPWKLAEMELKSRDLDPDEFKAGQQQGQGGPQGQQQPGGGPTGQNAPGQPGGKQQIDIQKAVDLAGQENQEMLQGNKIHPTPYAPMQHTQIHIEFIKSKKFKEQSDPGNKILKNFTYHIMGEIVALKARGGQGAQEAQALQQEVGGGGQGVPGQGQGNLSGSGPQGGVPNGNMQDVAGPQVQGGGDTQNVSGAQMQ